MTQCRIESKARFFQTNFFHSIFFFFFDSFLLKRFNPFNAQIVKDKINESSERPVRSYFAANKFITLRKGANLPRVQSALPTWSVWPNSYVIFSTFCPANLPKSMFLPNFTRLYKTLKNFSGHNVLNIGAFIRSY